MKNYLNQPDYSNHPELFCYIIISMNRSLKIIACGVLEEEIEAAAARHNISISAEYLTAGLHDEPDRLRAELQSAVKRTSDEVVAGKADYDAIVIGYGLCGRGTVGIKAGIIPLIMPRVHDCIALFLGSHKRYNEQFSKNPGTLYMSEGWYEHKTQPLSVKRKKDDGRFEGNWDIHVGYDSFKNKYGENNAAAIYEFLNTWKRNYTRSVYIDTGSDKGEIYENYAKDLAQELDWKYEKIKGGTELFDAMLSREYSDDEILIVPPGYMTAYDPLKNGLFAFDPNAGEISLWERALPAVTDEIPEKSGSREGLGLGIDAGGTYTDAVIYDFKRGEVIAKAKAPTTKWNFTIGITNAMKKLDPSLLPQVGITVVSTTLATNAIVEDRGRKVGLLVMPLAEIPAGKIEHDPWKIVGGRLSIMGDILEPVSEEEIKRAAIEMIDRDNVEAIAVSGYGSTVNPSHELQIKRIIEAETGLGVCCGHELSNTLNFFVRANTAVLNASIIPLLEQFIDELEQSLSGMDIGGSVMIVRGDGSLMSRGKAVLHPVETTLSGPAASVAGARFLAGGSDAVIIDVGGTTSDIGLISGGEIRLTEEGVQVGRWRTHIKAVDMFTLGAGGDSRILIQGRELKVGPQRVAPIGRLNDMQGSGEAVAFIEQLHADYTNSTAAMEILALTGREPDWQLSYDEEGIMKLLKTRPHSVRELAVNLTHGLWTILSTSRLENAAVIQRYGLTPTDILAAKGNVSLWPVELSEKVAGLYEIIWGDDMDDFAEDVFGLISDNLLRTLLLQEFDVSVELNGQAADDPVFKALLKNLKGDSRSLSLKPSLKSRLIGVGAAAPWLLSRLAGQLDSELVIPEDGDVANALGAVCSMVTVKLEASVTPASDGRFIVNGFENCYYFEAYEDACEYLEHNIVPLIRKEAVKAGTNEKRIVWEAGNRLTSTSDGNYIFLGRDYKVKITGLPA
ncbi:MAG TPA: hydantoinase/oxoprolinase [Spirochaeta sp.]|nr:hydantoinase/oxoprolinase [Spirochaeta sp.]